MIRSRRTSSWCLLRSSVLAAGVALLAGPSLATAANPAKATAFVRGPAAANNGGYPDRAIIGDVNGDGRDDFALGDWNTVSVVYGSSPTADIDTTKDLGTRGFRISTGTNGMVEDIAAAGDFDRDGIEDFIVSTDATTFVIYGARSTSGTLTLAAGGRMTALTGKTTNDVYDDAFPLGDFDGDSYPDLAVQRGDIGTAIVSGGPRVSSIALGSATGRVSHVNSTQRCGFVWFTFRCIYMGVPVAPIGDFDGDGKADLVVADANNPASRLLYGRTGRFTTTAADNSGKTTMPAYSTTGFSTAWAPLGDVTGDGLADAIGNGNTILPGRAGRPSSIPTSAPVIRLNSPSLPTGMDARGAGDQNGDGLADIVVATGGGNGNDYVLRVLTNLPRTAPATVNTDSYPGVAGLPGDFSWLSGPGDVDNDGLSDLLVATAFPGESAYVVSHGTNSPGPGTRFATLEGTFGLVNAGGDSIYYWSGTLSATCAGRTTPAKPLGYPATVLFTDAQEGDTCTVTATHSIDDPAPYANCTWVDTIVHNHTNTVNGSFTLTAGANTVQVTRQCKPPAGTHPTTFYQQGWWANGGLRLPTPGDPWVNLTDAANQARSLMWSTPLDWRNQTPIHVNPHGSKSTS